MLPDRLLILLSSFFHLLQLNWRILVKKENNNVLWFWELNCNPFCLTSLLMAALLQCLLPSGRHVRCARESGLLTSCKRNHSHDWSFVQHNPPLSRGGDGRAAKPFREWCPCLSRSWVRLDTGNDLVGDRATVVYKWSSHTGWFCCVEQDNVFVSIEIEMVQWAALKLRVSSVQGSPGWGREDTASSSCTTLVPENEMLSLNFNPHIYLE